LHTRVKRMSESLALHQVHNQVNGVISHYARTASQHAVSDPADRLRAAGIHRAANRAKHHWADPQGALTKTKELFVDSSAGITSSPSSCGSQPDSCTPCSSPRSCCTGASSAAPLQVKHTPLNLPLQTFDLADFSDTGDWLQDFDVLVRSITASLTRVHAFLDHDANEVAGSNVFHAFLAEGVLLGGPEVFVPDVSELRPGIHQLLVGFEGALAKAHQEEKVPAAARAVASSRAAKHHRGKGRGAAFARPSDDGTRHPCGAPCRFEDGTWDASEPTGSLDADDDRDDVVRHRVQLWEVAKRAMMVYMATDEFMQLEAEVKETMSRLLAAGDIECTDGAQKLRDE
jgi:hypothetical protein